MQLKFTNFRLISNKLKNMKNKLASATYLLFILLVSSCATLKTDSKSWTLMIPLEAKKKLNVNLADKSAFNVDIQNPTKDTLIIKQPNNQDQVIVNDKVSLSIPAGNHLEILNVSKKTIKPIVRIFDHKAKVVSAVSAF